MTFEECIKKSWTGNPPDANEYKSGWWVRSATDHSSLYKQFQDKIVALDIETMRLHIPTHIPIPNILASDFELIAYSVKRCMWEVPKLRL